MIRYIDRASKEENQEKVYGGFFIRLLYSDNFFSKLLSKLVLPLMARFTFPSALYGMLQKAPWSRSKIKRFIKKYPVDPSEFQDPVSSFKSFNDFFIRKLKPSSRPLAAGDNIAILPADARYLVFPNIDHSEGFFVKGKKFTLSSLLHDPQLAGEFANGAMVIARLAPVDYHRYHFPCDGRAATPKEIPGHLYSVNPLALKKHTEILAENKRMITEIETENFDKILYIEIGATYVGTIHQTFNPEIFKKKPKKKTTESIDR